MPIPFLDFPREIRDHIYSDILAPTTQFTLSRLIPHITLPVSYPSTRLPCDDTISSNILQTCHQIHREANHLFWAQNTYVVLLESDPWLFGDAGRRDFLNKVQKADLHFDLDQGQCSSVRRIIFFLATFSSLKSFRFIIEGEPQLLTRFRRWAQSLRAQQTAWVFGFLDEMRRDLGGIEVDVKLMLELGLGTLDAGTRSKMQAEGCEHLLWEMHDFLGAEVWVDGAMCYKDGKAVQKVFGDCEVAADPEALGDSDST